MFRIIPILIVLVVLNGCSTYRKGVEISETETRIETKRAEYRSLDSKRNELNNERINLLATLSDEKLSEEQLLDELNSVIARNNSLIAKTENERAAKEEIDRRIRGYRDELLNIHTDGNNLANAEKERRIQELRKSIRAYAM